MRGGCGESRGGDALGSSEKIEELKRAVRLPQIVFQYRNLLEEIQSRNLNGLDSLIKRADKACEDDDREGGMRIRAVLAEDFGDRADALFAIGQITRRFESREEKTPLKQRISLQNFLM